VAGKAIGFVPHHWAMIAGTLMQTGAQIGNHVLAKTLSDRVLRVANRDYFGPRRLAVRVCTTRALHRLVNAPDAQPDAGKLQGVGRKAAHLAESVAVRVPIIGGIVKRVIDANVQHVRRHLLLICSSC
jgi:hypothetical protein